jgi:hypothetical protein
MKVYEIWYNIGKVKYHVSYHDGIKKHPDGSAFFDAANFKNKKKLGLFIKELKQLGYKEA